MKKKLSHRNVRVQGLALLLSVVLLFVFLPVSAVAEVIGSLTATEEVPVEEVYEVTALREAGVKHFYVGEGKYTAVSYGEAVHRQDATGTWQEIDNTLTLQNGKYQTGDGRVQLAATNGSDNLLQLSENGYSIGLSFATGGADNTAPYALQSVNTAAATVQNVTREAVAEGDSPAVQYEKLSRVLNRSSLQYANLMANTDVRYTLHGNDVTGRITLRGQRESYNVALRLQLVGLAPSLDEAGNVILSDATTGTAVYAIPAPAVSAPGLVAAYQLLPVSDGLYLLGIATTPVLDDNISTEDFGSLTPGGENTAVTLSYSVIDTTTNYTDIKEAYVSSNSPNSNFQSNYSGMLTVGDGYVAFLKSPLPWIPNGAVVTNAHFRINCEGEDALNVGVHEVTGNWDEESVTWNSAGLSNATGSIVGVKISQFYVENSTVYEASVTDLASAWYSGSKVNRGVALKKADVDTEDYMCFWESSDNVVDGVEDYDVQMAFVVTYQYTAVDVPEGICYIKNVMYSGFLSANGSQSSYGTYSKVDEFANDATHQWRITDLENGYFEIESVQRPGYVLTAGPNIGSSPTVEPRDNTYDQQWDFANGYYGLTILPRTSYYTETGVYSRCLGVDVGNFLPSRNTKMCSNTDSSNQNEMWLLLPAANALNGQTVEDGFYIIDNLGIDYDEEIPDELVSLYMQSSETGVTAELEIYGTPSPRSRWRLKYLYNGYYNIISAANGRLLSVMDEQENTSERSLVLLNDIGSATQQWKITNVAPTGSAPQYKITPRSGEEYETDWCMSAGTGGYYTGDGAAVMQMPYSAERGLWSFSEVELRIINLNVFYDHSYDDKFTNAASRILTMLQETRMYYYQEFSIYINYSMPQLFESSADRCIADCYNEDCVHGETCVNPTFSVSDGSIRWLQGYYSDRNAISMMAWQTEALYTQWDAYGDGSDYFRATFTLIFTGNAQVCYLKEYKDNEGNTESAIHDFASRFFNGVTLIPTEGITASYNPCTSLILSQTNVDFEAQVVIHEIGHLFGTVDYYRTDPDKPVNHASNCTYNTDVANDLNTMAMCADCKQTVISNRNIYQHVFREVSQ